MQLNRSTSVTKRTSMAPRLETLEDRAVPAVISQTYIPGTGSMGTGIIVCDSASDTIVVTDNGTDSPGNVRVTVNGVPYNFPRPVWELRVYSGGGNDRVTYNLTQPLTSAGYYHEFEVYLGSGSDSFTANIPGLAGGAAGMNFYVDGQDGNDTIRANVYGTLASGTSLGFGLTGGTGSDSIVLDAFSRPLNINSGARLWANMHGYEGWTHTLNAPDSSNSMVLNYRGDLDGRLTFNLHGAGGTDLMSAYMQPLLGSTGYIGDLFAEGSASVLGGGGNDTMTFRVIEPGVGRVYNGVVDGGLGSNTAHWSQDVWLWRRLRVTNVPTSFLYND